MEPTFKENQKYLVLPKGPITNKFKKLQEDLSKELTFFGIQGKKYVFNSGDASNPSVMLSAKDLENLEFFEVPTKKEIIHQPSGRTNNPNEAYGRHTSEKPYRNETHDEWKNRLGLHEVDDEDDDDNEFEGMRIIRIDASNPNQSLIPENIRMSIIVSLMRTLSPEAQAIVIKDINQMFKS